MAFVIYSTCRSPKKLIEKYRKTVSRNCRNGSRKSFHRFTVFNVEPDSLNARRKLWITNMEKFQNKELKNE